MYIPKVISTNLYSMKACQNLGCVGFLSKHSPPFCKNVYIYHLAKLFIAKQKVTVNCYKLTYIPVNILEKDLKAINRYFGNNFNCSKYVLSDALL